MTWHRARWKKRPRRRLPLLLLLLTYHRLPDARADVAVPPGGAARTDPNRAGARTMALIGRGGPTTDDIRPEHWTWRLKASGVRLLLSFPPGFPRAIKTGEVAGLRYDDPFVELVGLCSPEESARLLPILQSLDEDVRALPVDDVGQSPLAPSCPVLKLEPLPPGLSGKRSHVDGKPVPDAPATIRQLGEYTVSNVAVSICYDDSHCGNWTNVLLMLRGPDGRLADVWMPPVGQPEDVNPREYDVCTSQLGPARTDRLEVNQTCYWVNSSTCDQTDRIRYRVQVTKGRFRARVVRSSTRQGGCGE